MIVGLGFEIQGNIGCNMYIIVSGFQIYSNIGLGLCVFGSGMVYGMVSGLES